MISFGMSVSTTAIFYPLARHVWALGSKWLLYFFLSACSPCLGPELRMAICLRRFRLSAIYIFLSACLPCLGPGLRTAILHRNHYSALRPCPLTAIFFWPCGLGCPLTAKSIFYSPHGGCSFYYSSASSRRYFIRASWR